MAIAGYRTTSMVHRGTLSLVSRANRELDGAPVIIKALVADYPTPRKVAEYRKEFDVGSRLFHAHVPGIVEPLALVMDNGRPAIVFADCAAQTLDELAREVKWPVVKWLRLMMRVAEVLGAVHHNGIVHKDIKPSNILVRPDTGEVWLIDFAISSALDYEEQRAVNPNYLEGSLPYISPEQTGRMNRPIDYRSDYYALGATLYEILCQRRPFVASDPMELVHCHIARRPQAPHEINPAIPVYVSAIVMRLLAKTAEERYQTSRGLVADLAQCAQWLEAGVDAPDFVPGRDDISDRFRIPARLYGRGEALGQLLAAAERASQGDSEILLVCGYSGIGKSALIHEVHKPISRQNAYFIAGKSDQFQRNIPYAAAIAAFGELVAQLLTESESQIQAWRDQLLAAFAGNGKIITDVIPAIELIIGVQPAVPVLTVDAARQRFNSVFLDFVRVFAQKSHPLVLFLDDLQWTDLASLQLLRLIMTDADIGYLLVMGSYRDNEVDAAHPLMTTLREIEKDANRGTPRGPLAQIHLSGLQLADLTQLSADALHCPLADARPLAELLLSKTGGNPFFVNQFLLEIYALELLHFDQQVGWQWNLEDIAKQNMTDNVVELVSSKINKLDAETQGILRIAAAVGNTFDLATLAAAAGKPLRQVADSLWEALREGFAVPLDETYQLVNDDEATASGVFVAQRQDANSGSFAVNPRYRFQHDRVQQAAYSLFSDQDRPIVHLQIGRTMLKSAGNDDVGDKLFAICDQVIHGIGLVTDSSEKYRFAQLCLRAGQKARQAQAADLALKYLTAGIALLGDSLWGDQYACGHALAFERAACAYNTGDFESADKHFEELLQRSRTPSEKADVFNLKLELATSRGMLTEGIRFGRQVLVLCGESLPEKGTLPLLLANLAVLQARLRFRKAADLLDMPQATDPIKLTALRLMNALSGPVFFVDQMLYSVLVLKMCDLSLRSGLSSEAAYSWGLFGMIAGPILGNLKRGMEFADLAAELQQRWVDPRLRPKVLFVLGGLVRPWGEHPRKCLPILQQGMIEAQQQGDVHYQQYCNSMLLTHNLAIGTPLDQIIDIASRGAEQSKRYKINDQQAFFIAYGHAGQMMRPPTKAVTYPLLDIPNPDAWLSKTEAQESKLAITGYRIMRMLDTLVMGDLAAMALEQREGLKYSKSGEGMYIGQYHQFISAMIDASRHDHVSAGEQASLRQSMRKHLKLQEKIADVNPEAHLHRVYLLQAELARFDQREIDAMALYDLAIEHAASGEFIHEAAFASERAALLHQNAGRSKVARSYRRDAAYWYLAWGALNKIAAMERTNPELRNSTGDVVTTAIPPHDEHTVALTETSLGSTLDLQSVMKAAQAFSGEIVLSKLLGKVVEVVIENAGARRALLVLDREGVMRIEAERHSEQAEIAVLGGKHLADRTDLSVAIVNYVVRTREPVVIEDSNALGKFGADPYLRAKKTRAVLCSPIIHQNRVKGVFYLENELTPGAFTPDRLKMLNLLSTQIAISIENADLYQNLQKQADAFARFVPQQFLTFLGKASVQDIKLGDAVQREMNVLFSDIRSFTTLSESMTPQENFRFLNAYLHRVGPVIRQHQGFIDKYIGDAVMALFPHGSEDALRAAIQMHRQVATYNQYRVTKGRPPIGIGVGLHFGPIMLGTIGEEQRMDGTVISDTVNIAARLEGLTKTYRAPILVSEAILTGVASQNDYLHRYLGEVQLRGKATKVGIYEVFETLDEQQRDLRQETRAALEQAIHLHQASELADALDIFEQILARNPDDGAAHYYAESCRAVLAFPRTSDLFRVIAADAEA